MSNNVASQADADRLVRIAATSRRTQKEPSSLPWHSVTLLFNELMNRTVKATEKIQYTVINANMEVMMTRSHFRDRLWRPLALFRHKKILQKNGHQVDWATDALHHGVSRDGNEAQICAWDTWRVSNKPRRRGSSGRADHRAMFGILFL
jgi:hypothetical protein